MGNKMENRQKFGFDALREGSDDWEFLYNLQRMSVRDAYNWACAMNGIIDSNLVAIRLVRLNNE